MKKNNIIILVLSTQDKSYQIFKKSIEKSWFKTAQNEGVNCYFYEGGYDTQEISGNLIKLTAKDDLLSTSNKLIEVFKVIRKEFPSVDVVYRTNLSSYIDVVALLKFMKKNKINKNSYAGIKGETYLLKEFFYLKNIYLHMFFSVFKFGRKLKFASGSGFFIGTENIDKVINRQKKLYLIDDVMVGYNLDGKVNSNNIMRFDIKENNSHKLLLEEYNNLRDKGLFHYRFKTSNRINDSDVLASLSDENNISKLCTLR